MEEQQSLQIGLDYALASAEVIEILLDDIEEHSLFSEIAKANTQRPQILNMLLEHHDTPDEVREYVRGYMQLPAAMAAETRPAKAERSEEEKRQSLTTKIQGLTVSARIQLALKGGREIRGILARDSNKEVMLSVLDNGKITDSEIELIVKNRSVLEEALRRISRNREWMRNYSILHGLVTNPKTPPGISVAHVSSLKIKDLIVLEKNKNVADAVRSAAKRVIISRKPR